MAGVGLVLLGTFLYDYRACIVVAGLVALVWYLAEEE